MQHQGQFAPSLPPAAGFRVDDGVPKLWTDSTAILGVSNTDTISVTVRACSSAVSDRLRWGPVRTQ